MDAVAVAEAHYRRQVALARRIGAETARIWRTMDTDFIDAWWARNAGDRMFAAVAGAQLLSAHDADRYLDQVLAAQDIDPDSEGDVNPQAFAAIASDGRPLDSLLYEPVITTKTAIGQGDTPTRAARGGLAQLDMIVRTQLADAGRVAVGVALSARRHVGGYVRMLSPPSCSRCVILAGRFYRWNAGFQRHPRCDCRHIPTRENLGSDLTTNPRAYMESLSQDELERVLGKAGAQAFNDGADLNQIVNARRGMEAAGVTETRVNEQGFTVNVRHRTRATREVFGQQVFTTIEGVTRRGLAGQRLAQGQAGRRFGQHRAVRLMPEQIYANAVRLGWSREETIAQLRRHGYIL